MNQIFRKIRKNLLAGDQLGRYLMYALGEIVLVVFSILLALQINNWNEQRVNDKQLLQILSTIRTDLVSDTVEVRNILDNYEQRRPVFERVLNDSATYNDYLTQPFYGFLVSTYIPLKIEERGYSQLKSFNNFTGSEPETIASQINQFYSVFIKNIEETEKAINDDVYSNLKYWKENMNWFSKVSKGEAPNEFMNYVLEDPDYKNRVAFHQAIVYNNYLPFLEAFQANAKVLLVHLNKKLE